MAQKSDADLLADLESPDEFVRAEAAGALTARRHPRALEASLRTLNDGSEPAHADLTPAVWSLAGLGLPALKALLGSLADPDPMTRRRASRAVAEITKRHFGFDGRDWPRGAYEKWAAWWTTVAYEPDAAPQARDASIARLRAASEAWLAGREA